MRFAARMLGILVVTSALTCSHLIWMTITMRTQSVSSLLTDDEVWRGDKEVVLPPAETYDRGQMLLALTSPRSYNVREHLRDFTGLSNLELERRLRRLGNYDFHREHAFWAPTSTRELAWYYATSVDYLFANAVHPASPECQRLDKQHEPVLDFSGGVGNQVLDLATRGVRCEYMGIGLIEAAFAAYRVRRLGLNAFVTFVPVDKGQDARAALLDRREYYGAIMAMDVLEHIPHYERIVGAMVASLKVGGVLFERTPFGVGPGGDGDLDVHVGMGNVSMADAMGPCMQQRAQGHWIKIKQLPS